MQILFDYTTPGDPDILYLFPNVTLTDREGHGEYTRGDNLAGAKNFLGEMGYLLVKGLLDIRAISKITISQHQLTIVKFPGIIWFQMEEEIRAVLREAITRHLSGVLMMGPDPQPREPRKR